MNGRTILWVTLMALGLGATLARADGLIHPVAYDDRMGPVYYPTSGTVFYGSVNQPVFNVGNPAPAYEPPSYTQPAHTPPAYTSPAYTQPNYAPPVYAVRAPVQHPAVCCLHRPAVTTYVPTYTSYRPALATTYRAPVYQAATPVAAGPRVIVRPKVYVEGQPLRNLIKAITP